MERGVASRGGGSQPLAVGARHPPSGHYTTGVRGVRWDRSGRKSGEGKAPARPKIATVERREASVSRETRAPHTRPGRAARHAPRVPQHPHVISALRHPSFRVREAKSKTRAQKRAAGTKKHVLFDN